jgi:hypothetical protein
MEKGNINMLKISIDCNSNFLGFDKPTLSPFEIEYFSLKEGNIVIGFQDDLEWEGTIRYDSTLPEGMNWYLELDLQKEYSVSDERVEGREEGARSAIPIGEIRGESIVVTAMLADGVSIDTVKKYTRLPKARLINIYNNLSNQQK